jgi:ADP-heptose:LPS heptosyltransferase
VASQLTPAAGNRAEKILVIFPGALGDFICFLPALEALARRRRVDLLSRAEYADLAPRAVHVSSLERREVSRLFVPGAAPDAELERYFGAYASIYSWLGSGDKNLACAFQLLAGTRARLFPFQPDDDAMHISDYYLQCVGAPRLGELGAIPLNPDALCWRRRWCDEHELAGKKILALAPGSGAKEKNWPAGFFSRVARWWEEETKGKSIVVLGPTEEEGSEGGADWAGAVVARNLALAQVAALLSCCDIYLGNDSGTTHLAARLGIETVALFGPSDARQWAPRGKRVTVVSRGVECSPCDRRTMKICPHRRCLAELMPEAIIDAIRAVLARKKANFLALTRG